MWWWLSCGGGCHVVVIVMWWWFSCKIKHGNGDRCWLYRACWWLSCGGGCHVVLIVIGTGCHVVVEVIGNDCPGSGWLLTHKWSACSIPVLYSFSYSLFVCSTVKEEGQGYHLKKLKQHQLDGFSPMFAHVFTASWFHSFQLESLGSPFRRIATCISITLGSWSVRPS